jgi:ubiquinone biosynthesis protein UbiJ
MQALPPPLQAAINHLLGQASWAREKLMPFAGHAAQIKLPPFEAAFLITPDGSIAAPAPDAELEVAISLPAATPLLALQGKDAVMRAARIEGSAEFAQALGFVIRNLRWMPRKTFRAWWATLPPTASSRAARNLSPGSSKPRRTSLPTSPSSLPRNNR